jgi:acyl-CoA synthetase (AMP-forming)/AMP-acid ligase II
VLTLADPLEHARRVHPDRVAVIDGETRLSYRELAERCAQLASGLRALGVGPGERVALLAQNSHRYFEAFFAIAAHGMVLVPLNTRLAPPELEAILADSGARVLISDRDPGPLAARVERVLRIPDDYEALLASTATPPAAASDENAVAALFYTGGTTGLPKGVMLTHRNLIANAFHKTIACSLTGDDVFLAAPAMFHVAGVAPLVGLTWLGARTVTLPSFDPERCLDLIAEHRITLAIPVPTMLASLVAAQRRSPRDVSSLRLLGHAGSAIANELIEAAHATFPAAELAQFYGATETASIVTSFRHEQAAIGTPLLGSCGRATPGVAVRVVRADGSECEPGEVGEVLVRGPNVTAGYFRNPEATAAALVDGWYHSGDLGLLREGGHLFVVDRIKDMIVSGAENVYSIEVEAVLQRHPAVVEAAVFGIPDPVWGEAVHAVVVVSEEHAPGGDALAAALKHHCRKAVAGYKVPKRIDIQLEPLPKSGPGKILKRAIRDRFWREPIAEERAADASAPRRRL